MRPRALHTQFDLIASNYEIIPNGDKFIHRFTPKSTQTIYQFESTNSSKIIVEGNSYNIGYIDIDGIRYVDLASLSDSTQINPRMSLLVAIQVGRELYHIEKSKNDDRVRYTAKNGYYWGKKYAWRVFGACIAQDAFYEYLKEISHPFISCIVDNPPHPPGKSIAYLETGLNEAMEHLMTTATKKGRFYVSPHYSKSFTIKGVNAITDKK